MTRSSAAQRPLAVQAPVDLSPVEHAANDGAASRDAGAVPRYIVSPTRAAEFRAEAAALSGAAIEAQPTDIDEQLQWADRIQATAWRDRHALVAIGVADDPERVTLAVIDRLGERIAWVREQVVETSGSDDDATAKSVAAMPTVVLRARIEASQRVLHNAFMYRFRNDRAQRARLRDAKGTTSKAKVTARSALLLKLSAPAAVEAWLRGAPNKEGEALDALRPLHAEWVHRVKTGIEPGVSDAAARAFSTLRAPLKRVLDAGRYLALADSSRKGDYAAFKRAPARRAAKPDAPVPTPANPTG